MRRLTVLSLAAALALLVPTPAPAQTAPLPVVSVVAGPAVEQWLVQPCSDVVVSHVLPLSFVLRRTGPLTGSLTASYTTSGTAQPGVHFEPLPGTATFAAGADTAVVAVVPLPGPEARKVDLALTLRSVSGPASFGPTSASIEFVSPWDERPVECGYRFTADPWNTT